MKLLPVPGEVKGRAGTRVDGSCLSGEIWTQGLLSIHLGPRPFSCRLPPICYYVPQVGIWNLAPFRKSSGGIRGGGSEVIIGAGPGPFGHITSLLQELLEGTQLGTWHAGAQAVTLRRSSSDSAQSFLLWPPGLRSTCPRDLPRCVRRAGLDRQPSAQAGPLGGTRGPALRGQRAASV